MIVRCDKSEWGDGWYAVCDICSTHNAAPAQDQQSASDWADRHQWQKFSDGSLQCDTCISHRGDLSHILNTGTTTGNGENITLFSAPDGATTGGTLIVREPSPITKLPPGLSVDDLKPQVPLRKTRQVKRLLERGAKVFT